MYNLGEFHKINLTNEDKENISSILKECFEYFDDQWQAFVNVSKMELKWLKPLYYSSNKYNYGVSRKSQLDRWANNNDDSYSFNYRNNLETLVSTKDSIINNNSDIFDFTTQKSYNEFINNHKANFKTNLMLAINNCVLLYLKDVYKVNFPNTLQNFINKDEVSDVIFNNEYSNFCVLDIFNIIQQWWQTISVFRDIQTYTKMKKQLTDCIYKADYVAESNSDLNDIANINTDIRFHNKNIYCYKQSKKVVKFALSGVHLFFHYGDNMYKNEKKFINAILFYVYKQTGFNFNQNPYEDMILKAGVVYDCDSNNSDPALIQSIRLNKNDDFVFKFAKESDADFWNNKFNEFFNSRVNNQNKEEVKTE
ncbi:hypothetical protein [Apilactobacillus timberlakei]|uniref:hypothetical protein n=1 Tax=Apilactobacillus timberlakei TaxID=2008380 RepID=UPI0011284934|nr:hypothetical protein [Apilactobacillus timberlakei]TPR16755.1 hypothetical protein DYZ95_07175 [Apilactobacillus timberlakei]TPR21518.1 hypothetical protein DY083_05725 [Apilactobacillus timberlakei]